MASLKTTRSGGRRRIVVAVVVVEQVKLGLFAKVPVDHNVGGPRNFNNDLNCGFTKTVVPRVVARSHPDPVEDVTGRGIGGGDVHPVGGQISDLDRFVVVGVR